MTKISEAREKYEEKVCEEYLGIPESYCADEFQKLLSNMKAGIMAVKGSSSDPEFEALRFDKVDLEALEESEKIVIPLEELKAHLDDIASAISEASIEHASEPKEFRGIQHELNEAKDMARMELERAKTETEDAPEISETTEPKLERAIAKLENKVEEAKRFLRGEDFEEASAIAEVDIPNMKGEIDTLIDPLETDSYLKRESPERKGKGIVHVPF